MSIVEIPQTRESCGLNEFANFFSIQTDIILFVIDLSSIKNVVPGEKILYKLRVVFDVGVSWFITGMVQPSLVKIGMYLSKL